MDPGLPTDAVLTHIRGYDSDGREVGGAGIGLA
jgi:hypothetical protein